MTPEEVETKLTWWDLSLTVAFLQWKNSPKKGREVKPSQPPPWELGKGKTNAG